MDTPEASPAAPRSTLPRKLVLLFLLTTAAALGIVFLFRAGHPVSYLNLLILDSALLGLVAGFGARLVLKGRRSGLRLLAAIAALTAGLVVLGASTGWQFGLGPLTFRPARFDWAGLVQLVTGTLAATLSLYAWRRPPPAPSAVDKPPTQPAVRGGIPDLPRRPRTVKAPKPVAATRETKPAKKPQPSTGSKTRTRTRVQSVAKPRAKTVRTKPAASSPRRRPRKPEVQFATSEEHRCPYCLEFVQPNDPRGIVECNICHTLHHADCWAITGACQVPHLNS